MKEYSVQCVDGGDLQLLLQTLTTDGWIVEHILPLHNQAYVVSSKARDPLSFEALRELSHRSSSFEEFWLQLQSRVRAGFYDFVINSNTNEWRIKRKDKLVVGPGTVRHPLSNKVMKRLSSLGEYNDDWFVDEE